ncbi:hypothetical protein [Wenxinia marina]|uniref:Metal binding domain of Ada n=1 Tax=Wenxinia marina DSM 24838 TaxID=1123501 RepID=A0A0D0PEM8_9RHOB|nr:hypothetical protein [Wenxinia marina]KIQ69856.1 hypothetical protein Wenmar_01426 [Wenxinia marina DSM 24838]GGL61728.1 hypothetical protein GCM10011392_15290 [Wenxinia marina]
MTLQNRVQPDGAILAHPARGAFMGNRGILHDDQQRLGAARWRNRTWVCCVLDFKGRQRPVMAPGRYTELFFHDEAVALAAGHRPCAECRRADYERFRDAWATAFGSRPAATEMDATLHAARAQPGGRRLRRHEADAEVLPDGTFVDAGNGPGLLWDGALWPFGPDGYRAARPRLAGGITCLTPPPTVRAMAAGYRPQVRLDRVA